MTNVIARPAVRCTICGTPLALAQPSPPFREGGKCNGCGGRHRDRDQAQAALSFLARGTAVSLSSAVKFANEMEENTKVLEVAYTSPFKPILSSLPCYVQGYYWKSGHDELIDGKTVLYVDLQKMSFSCDTFDLIITSEVLQFVVDEEAAHREIHRVLKVGGAHIASVPFDWPVPVNTQELCQMSEGVIVSTGSERYFRTPDGGSMPLMRRHGADLLRRLREMGFAASLRRSNFVSTLGRRNVTIVAIKL